jgi:hypothetical protein
MDDIGATLTAIGVTCLMALGVVFLIGGTLDSDIKKSCEQRGYWQTGQTRVICSIEKTSKEK